MSPPIIRLHDETYWILEHEEPRELQNHPVCHTSKSQWRLTHMNTSTPFIFKGHLRNVSTQTQWWVVVGLYDPHPVYLIDKLQLDKITLAAASLYDFLSISQQQQKA